ncbi:tail fiber domain-containing protein [Flavobacterium chilense]|uniref:Chaperone of endosialidase n=1 Tax=Flavobacterium chilense TaxID=946677 RepID=A0A1M7CWW3_9FLAO|nr:tail fiber domain-containing protein [Flavobacterium chilense]SHL71637.1 Chaperone of endosialidase [Flavobacterium chilense]
MKKIVCLLLLVQSAFIIAQTKTVVTPYGEKVTININTVNTADNGLTKTDENVQLGGTLLKPTTIETDADNTLAISNLQAGVITDDILVANAAGVLKKISSELLTNNWSLSGNAGTIPGTNFLGTTDDKSLMFKLNNQISGMLTSPTNGANTSFGYLSLMNPDVENGGISNSAFGVGSLLANTTGTNNTAMGMTALQNNKTGKNNAAIGSSALGSNEIGNDNTSMGAWALYAVKNGSGNTGVGLSAGYNVLGDFNTLIGYKSGFHIETGSNNIVIGANSTGDINPSTPTASNELNIGNTLFGTGINGAVGGTAGKVGVNTNSPQAELDVNGKAKIRNLPAGATADKIVTADTDGNLRTLLPADLVPATTVSNTSLVNTLTTTVNDVTGTAVNIINSNTLTATNGSLISTINGVETTPAVSVLISANNGLTATNGNVQLDGALIKPTTITTDAANTLAVAGLQSASPTGTDNIVVVNSSGVLSTLDRSILNNGWLLKGNAGTNPANNFLGTTDDQPLFFRINNNYAGHIAENNTSLGNSSLNPFVTGQFNTAMGSNSLSALTDGTNNTVTGVQNFQGLTSGSYNVAMGVENIGALTSGWNNIAIGAGNLSIETGNQNIAIGAGVGQGLLNGSSNILIGGSTSYRIDASGPDKSNELNIGNALFGKAINSAIGTASIGINTNNPGNTFEVKSAAANTSGLRLSNLTSTSPATAASVATLGINATGDVVVVNSAPATTTNTLVAANGNLVSTVNGVASTPAVPVLISANNGLTATIGNVQLGGTLTQTPTTTITTDATHTLAIAGLQTTTTPVTDNIILADPTTGVLKTKSSNLFAWNLLGNAGTNPAIGGTGTDFFGTTDSKSLMFRVKNVAAGMVGIDVSGNYNTALGLQTLTNWTGIGTTYNGSSNTALGYNALAIGGTVSDNTAVGANALKKATGSTFAGNTAVGSAALANANSSTLLGRNTGIGFLALTANTSGSYNTALGASSMNYNTTGGYNVALGNLTLQNSTTGSYNIAIGNGAGMAAGMTGSSNIIIGGTPDATTAINTSSAAASNELNIGNTLFGTGINGAIGNTTSKIGINTNAPIATLDVRGAVRTGTPDIALAIGTNSFAGGNGAEASGLNSFAFGAAYTSPVSGATSPAGKATGEGAIAFGTSIASGGLSFAVGNSNTSSGELSTSFGQGNTTGGRFSATIGQNNNIAPTVDPAGGFVSPYRLSASFATGYNNQINASNSAAFGSSNTINSTKGGQNGVAMGTLNVIDGNSSVAMGRENTTTSSYSVVIGYQNKINDNVSTYSVAAGNGNNIYNSKQAFVAGSGNIIGSSIPTNIGDYSAAFGNTNKIGTTTPASAAFVAGQNNTVNGNYSAAIGYTNYVYDQYAVAMGSNATVAATHKGAFVFGDNSNSSAIASTASNQFTGMFNGGYRLLTNRLDLTKGMTMDVLGNVVLSGSITATAAFTPSDIRLKKDIQTLTGVLNNIKQLRGVTYYWKDAAKGTDLQLGMIAQELEKVYPELVFTNKETGFKVVNYAQFTGVLLEGVKEQQTQIEDLKSEVETLKKQVQEIKDLLKK